MPIEPQNSEAGRSIELLKSREIDEGFDRFDGKWNSKGTTCSVTILEYVGVVNSMRCAMKSNLQGKRSA